MQKKYMKKNIRTNVLEELPQDGTFDISIKEIEKGKHHTELNMMKEVLKSKEQNREERKDYATKVYRLLVIFLSITFSIVIANGIICFYFQLSDVIIVTILTTSSANIIALFAIVMKYLFKENN
jgi:hypothetical protein